MKTKILILALAAFCSFSSISAGNRQLIQYGFPNAQCRESKPQFIRFGIAQTIFVRAERNKIDDYYRC